MIREATEQDAEVITEIFNYYIRNTVITFEEDEINTVHFIERFNKVKRSGFSWLVAVDDGDVIGFAYSSRWIDRASYRNTAEVSVYLVQTATSKGWGTKLYNELFSILRQKSIHVAICGITLPNPASVAIHEKFGMKKIAHFEQVGYKFGEWLDVGYWQVQLNA